MPGINPSNKAPAIDLMISKLAGKSREIQLASELCMTCDGKADTFKDELSIKAGGRLEAIKSKYKLTATTEKALLDEQKANTEKAS